MADEDTISTDAIATLRHVAARSGLPMQISGSNTQAGFRTWNVNYTQVRWMRIYFANFYASSAVSGVETPAGADMTLRCAVEYPRGKFTSITTTVIPDGGIGYVDISVSIPAFAIYRICGDINYPAAGRVVSSGWANNCDRGNGDEYQVGPSGYGHITDGTVLGSGGSGGIYPLAVLAYSKIPVWSAIGDSITAGVNDTISCASGGRGLFGRALSRIGPHLNMGLPGDRATWFTTNSVRRMEIMRIAGVSRAVLALGVNDFANSRTSANVLADRTSIRALAPSWTWIDATVTPSTTSTDNWQTAANQTVTSAGVNTQRTTFNDALRSGTAMLSGSSGTIDLASMVETSTTNERGPILNGGVWIPGMVGYTDGVHPSSTGVEQIDPYVHRALSARR